LFVVSGARRSEASLPSARAEIRNREAPLRRRPRRDRRPRRRRRDRGARKEQRHEGRAHDGVAHTRVVDARTRDLGSRADDRTRSDGHRLTFAKPRLWARFGGASNVRAVLNGRPLKLPYGTFSLELTPRGAGTPHA